MSVERALIDLDAVALADEVRRGAFTPRELMEAAIARAEAHRHLDAIVHPLYALGRRVASGDLPDGPFRGVPFLLKDLHFACAGTPLQNGSRLFEGRVSDYDSTLVRRYKRAGLVVFGKSSTPEFGITPVTEPDLHGPTRNPWDLDRTAGGSSGGAAAAVAARIVPMAHASDGGGSIRGPAACCGIFGLKPTRGRTPWGPRASEGWGGFSAPHVVSISVRDSAVALDATAGLEPGAPYDAPAVRGRFADAIDRDPPPLRIGFTTRPHLPAVVHPDCVRATEDAASLLASLGHHVEEVRVRVDGLGFARDFLRIMAGSIATLLATAERELGRAVTRGDVQPTTWLLRELGRSMSAADFGLAREALASCARDLGRFFEGIDVLLTPTLGSPPLRHGALAPHGLDAVLRAAVVHGRLSGLVRARPLLDKMASKVFAFVPFTPVWNVTGQPSMNVPLHWNADGLPIGTMFTGRFGDEPTLLQLAAQLERARPWAGRRPPGGRTDGAASARRDGDTSARGLDPDGGAEQR